jgi:hypothetical protein
MAAKMGSGWMNNVLVSSAALNSKGICKGKVNVGSRVLGDTE